MRHFGAPRIDLHQLDAKGVQKKRPCNRNPFGVRSPVRLDTLGGKADEAFCELSNKLQLRIGQR